MLDEADFQACLQFTLGAKGGFANNGLDPGGATKYGITISLLQRWRPSTRVTGADVEALSLQSATMIYRADFWNMPKLALLRRGVDLMVFDFSVNTSPFQSIKQLQGVLGVKQDGYIGSITTVALTPAHGAVAGHDAGALINNLATAHAAYYQSLDTFSTRGNDWLARTERVRVAALARAHSRINQTQGAMSNGASPCPARPSSW
jgi:lysozyme family protein